MLIVKTLVAFLSLAGLGRPALAAAPAVSAEQAVKKVQSYYSATQKLKADFRQEYTNATFGRTSNSDGVLWIAKPGKMRWDYKTPTIKYFISDGTTLWVYDQPSRQAFQQSLKDQILPVAVTFLFGQGNLTEEFHAELDPGKYGGKNDVCVKLTPKKPEAQYKNLWLVIDASDFHVKESVILEASDNINHFSFFNVKTNDEVKKLDAKHFTFVPPPGTRLIKTEGGQIVPGE